MIKILLWTIGIICVGGILAMASIAFKTVFISKTTSSKVNNSNEYEALSENIQIREISEENEPVLEYEPIPNSGDAIPAKEVIVHDDDSFEYGERLFDKQPGKRGVALGAPSDGGVPLLFVDNDIFTYDNLTVGKKLFTFDTPKIENVSTALGLNDSFLLLHAYIQVPPMTPATTHLYQVSTNDFKATLLTDDPYFDFSRPTKVFKAPDQSTLVIVYYVGALQFGYGGDSSRPKWSVVRLFNSKDPSGVDIVQLSFKAGTIVDVKFADQTLVLRSDPSLPQEANKERVPSRVWEVSY